MLNDMGPANGFIYCAISISARTCEVRCRSLFGSDRSRWRLQLYIFAIGKNTKSHIFCSSLAGRTNIDLKDKWRSLQVIITYLHIAMHMSPFRKREIRVCHAASKNALVVTTKCCTQCNFYNYHAHLARKKEESFECSRTQEKSFKLRCHCARQKEKA